MAYVDGYLIPVPKKKLAAYMKMARAVSKVFLKHGARRVCECAGDQPGVTWAGMAFAKLLKLKRGETMVFAWVEFRSKAERDRVNKKVGADPAMKMPKKQPFDWKRSVCGGFKVVVDA